MKHRYRRSTFASCACLAIIAGCAPMPADIRVENATNLGKLAPGMSRAEIDAIMGTQTHSVREGVYHEQGLIGYIDLTVPNPYRTETFVTDEGTFEVLYYYALVGGTHVGPWNTNYPERTVPVWLLSPVVLRDGKLVGRGFETMISAGLMEPPSVPVNDPSILVGR
jgi:hypothetical protein